MFSQNVGINNTDPERPLTIRGTGAAHNLISLRDTNNITLWHINFLNGGLNFARTGLEDGRLFLGHNGNLGIGTVNPASPLHVVSNYSSEIAHFLTGDDVAQLRISTVNGTGMIGLNENEMFIGSEAGPNARDLRFNTTGIARVTIKAGSGNTGIGVTNPVVRLHVFGATAGIVAQFSSLTDQANLSISNNAGTAQIGMIASSLIAGSQDNVDFRIRTSGTDRVFVKPATGNVGIGEVSNPVNRLDVGGAMVIGAAYSGSFPAPVNGLLVEGNVGIQTVSAGTSLTVNGGVAINSQTINVSGPLATVNAGNRSYIRINNTGAIQTIITMADGLSDGQILVIFAQSSGGGAVQFTDAVANNTQLNSNYAMGIDDTLTLIWDSTLSKWIELHRSVN